MIISENCIINTRDTRWRNLHKKLWSSRLAQVWMLSCASFFLFHRVTTFQITWNSPTFPVEESKDYLVSSVYRYGQQSLFYINEKQGEAR